MFQRIKRSALALQEQRIRELEAEVAHQKRLVAVTEEQVGSLHGMIAQRDTELAGLRERVKARITSGLTEEEVTAIMEAVAAHQGLSPRYGRDVEARHFAAACLRLAFSLKRSDI